MKRLSNGTRILVDDGAHALVFRNEGDAQAPNLKLVKSYGQGNPPTRELGSDKPGRSNDSHGRRSSMETTDWHQVAEDRFVEQVASDMERDLAAGQFDKLVLAAPPIALGASRKVAGSRLAKATILELDKDLTKHPVLEIEKAVVKALEQAGDRR